MLEMLRIAWPVILGYLGIQSMAMVDLIAVGQVSPSAIGAMGVGNSIAAWFLVFGIGLVSGLDYIASHAHGAREPERAHRGMIQSLLISFWMSVPMIGILFFMSAHLEAFKLNPEIVPMARSYLRIMAVSTPLAILFNVFRSYLQGMGVVKPPMVILGLANIVNLLGNYVLTLGHWGCPRLGATGSALATLFSRLFMLGAIAWFVIDWDRARYRFFKRISFAREPALQKELLQLGVPTAFQLAFEVGVFALATTLAGRFRAVDLAAHQVVLGIASFTFMVPLGVGSAAAALVGRSVGAKDAHSARQFGHRAFALGVSFMACSCAVMLLFPFTILGLFTQDPDTLRVATGILVIAAIFQISDGAQVVGTGALRGLADTRASMLANLVGHWMVGLPVGVLLAFRLGYGLWGLWVGLSLGLTSVAISLVLRWRNRIARLEFS